MKRVALVHDWLVTHRGGEQVLLELARAFPSAPIYTLVFDSKRVHPELAHRDVRTSFIQKLPGAPLHFRQYLPLFPSAIESFSFADFDVVISTSHCVAKGAKARGVHVSYVHTPMRYIWDQLPSYVPHLPARALALRAVELAVQPLRHWDVTSAGRPTELVANSAYVAERIARVWKRRATVVHPPVDTSFYLEAPEQRREGYLVVSALVPYKRVEVAVEAAVTYDFPLTVIGSGSERERLERLVHAASHNTAARPPASHDATRRTSAPRPQRVTFIASASAEELRRAYASARALLFCGVEDFGIVPVEAQAAGCPVIALGAGGALETVVDGETGIFLTEPTAACLAQAIARIETMHFDRSRLAGHAQSFSFARFHESFQAQLAFHGVAYETHL